jgi:tetratricopeptide (TPR) repeat protein/predicted Ser/Thr protein kinase
MLNSCYWTIVMLGQTISHYHITAKLGAGGMGEVYQATDTRLDRAVALKFLPRQFSGDPDARARFEREAKALAALNHPNIVSVFDVAEHDGCPYIVMEYLEGHSVRQLVADGDIKTESVLDIVAQIAQGLAAAHKHEIVHRDIKSENIIVTSEGRVKIMDFGLATWRGVTKVTQEGSTIGTMAYMSPEQAQGKTVDQRTDLWSLGVVFYELLTGRLPFAGEHEAAVTYSIVNETPEPLARYKSGVPDELQRIVDQALEKDPDTRYQTAAGILADVHRLQKSRESGLRSAAARSPERRRRLTAIFVPSILVIAAVILLLILRPWQVEIQTTQEAAAAEDCIAVMYFDNFTDPDDTLRCGEVIATLLISDLTESDYVRVVSSQRLYDILKILGKEGTRVITPDIATQVARQARARWMITGGILETEPTWVVNAQLVEVASGDVLASPTISGAAGERVYDLVDRLTHEIKEDLTLPAEALAEADPPVEHLTSPSIEAYRLYLEGKELERRFDEAAAEQRYRKAIALDTTFAMAYNRLAFVRYLQGDMADALEAINRAVKYVNHASQRDREDILAIHAAFYGRFEEAVEAYDEMTKRYPDDKEAYYWSANLRAHYLTPRDLPGAIDRYLKAIEIDPLFKDVYNELAYTYDQTGDFERSVWAINKYIELAPNEPNPYDTRAELFATNGEVEKALDSYLHALKIQPDFFSSTIGAAKMHMFREEYTAAEKLLRSMTSNQNPDMRSMGRAAMADIALHQGLFREAIDRLETAIQLDDQELGRDTKVVWHHGELAWAYELVDDFDAAVTEIRRARDLFVQYNSDEPHMSLRWRYDSYEAILLAEAGNGVRADSLLENIGTALAQSPDLSPRTYWYGRAFVAFHREQFDTALAYLLNLAGKNPDWGYLVDLGRAYHGARRYRDAISKFERALGRYDMTRWDRPASSVLLHYWLGLTYEKAGRPDDALAQYERFLQLWRNADPVVSEIEDARERVAALSTT